MKKQYHVRLTPEERRQLQQMIASGESKARKLNHARVLLKADSAEEGLGWSDEAICAAVEVSPSTVVRVRKRFAQEMDMDLRSPTADENRPFRPESPPAGAFSE